MEDKQLIEACKERSFEGQKQLYIRYAPVLRAVCHRYIRDREQVKDVLQDAFIEIYRSIYSYKGQGSFVGWLKRVVIYTAVDHIRKNQRYKLDKAHEIKDIAEEEFEDTFYLKLLDLPDYEHYLQTGIGQLPDILSLVFNMFYIDDMSHKEIADMLDIDEVTSRTRLARARKLIKDHLENILNKFPDERSFKRFI